jgi:hypothetical protein
MHLSDVSRCSFFVEQLQLSICVFFVFLICLVEDVSERAVICLLILFVLPVCKPFTESFLRHATIACVRDGDFLVYGDDICPCARRGVS